MAQTLTQIRSLLAAYGLSPKKRFGQNFLHDGNQMARILAAADLKPDDIVLEVGPGTGALTGRLLEAGARVVAVEVDRDLEPLLCEQFASFDQRFVLIVDDVLAGKHTINPRVIDALRSLGGHDPVRPPDFKLIANLPYNIASPLLVNLAVDHPAMQCAIVMVQREVAERMVAGPGGKAYGPLTVMLHATCRVDRLFHLSPACFWPAPTIESAVVKLERLPAARTADPHALAALVHRLFSRRRKQLGAILGRDRDWPEGIEPTQRPEQLDVEQLIALVGSSV